MVLSATLALGLYGIAIEPTIPIETRYERICLAVYETVRGRVRQGYAWDSFELTPLRQSAERQGVGIIGVYDARLVAPPPFAFDRSDRLTWAYFPAVADPEREPWSDVRRANPLLLRGNAEAVLRAAGYDLDVRERPKKLENQTNLELTLRFDFVKYGIPTLGGSGLADVTLDYETAQVRKLQISPPLVYPPSPPRVNFSLEDARGRLAALCAAHGQTSIDERYPLELRLIRAENSPRAQLNRFRSDQHAAAARGEGTYAYDVGFVGMAGPEFREGYMRLDPTTGEVLQFSSREYIGFGRVEKSVLPLSPGAYALYGKRRRAAVTHAILVPVVKTIAKGSPAVTLRRGTVYDAATYDRKARLLSLSGRVYRPNRELAIALDRVTR